MKRTLRIVIEDAILRSLEKGAEKPAVEIENAIRQKYSVEELQPDPACPSCGHTLVSDPDEPCAECAQAEAEARCAI